MLKKYIDKLALLDDAHAASLHYDVHTNSKCDNKVSPLNPKALGAASTITLSK